MGGENGGGGKPDPAVRLWSSVVGSLLMWVVSLAAATLVLSLHPRSVALRAAMALLAVSGFGAQDEFTQRLHLIAIAGSFAVTGLLAFAADFLQRAGFIGQVPVGPLWIVMVLTWWLSMALTRRRYR